jgi:hypothetical protein
MKLQTLLTFSLALLLNAPPATAQERGNWRAAGSTAQSITGDVAFSGEKFTISFIAFPVAEIRPLNPAEIAAAFEAAEGVAGLGHLYRLSIPADRRFLHKNTLCGSEETQWMATFVSGKTLRIALFSNATPPTFTAEALNNNPNLCGTFSYVH